MSKVEENIELERIQFKSLLLQNPNYFGNFSESKYKPVKKIANNTTYEELTCVGFNPDLQIVEATIAIKRPLGYAGNLCYAGSNEFVRFFVDYGSGWVDEGVVSVNVHDIPDENDCLQQKNKPLTYVVTLQIDPEKYKCSHPFLPKVHAVLSWNVLPPVTVNIPPVWGNAMECNIQINPRKPIILDVFDDAKLKIPPEYEVVSDMPIPIPDPPALTLSDLAELYQGKLSAGNKSFQGEQTKVGSHRFGFTALKSMLVSNTFKEETITEKINEWKSLGIDFQAALSVLQKTKANVDYEEIECVGLDYNKESLIATFRVKRPYGYLGDLCRPGSFEHVAFWADWNNECRWTYLGTTSVKVHDFDDNLPTDGVCYFAYLPVSLNKLRKGCENPKISRIRAVLSWNDIPSTTDPEDLTYWGNRLDTHVQIRPGIVLDPGDHSLLVESIGSMPPCNINQATGLSSGDNITFTWSVEQSPFGGCILIKGDFPNKIDYLGTWSRIPRLKYRISVRALDPTGTPIGTPIPIINTFTVQVNSQLGGSMIPSHPVSQIADSDGFYEYLESDGANWLRVGDRLLAKWQPKPSEDDGKWEIVFEAKDALTGTSFRSIAYPCEDGTTRFSSNSIIVCLDNTEPKGGITIDLLSDSNFIESAVPTTPAIACGDFARKKYIIGRFSVTDDDSPPAVSNDPHFREFSLGLSPFPSSLFQVSSPSIPTSGIPLPLPPSPSFPRPLPSGIWQLNTDGLIKCGYVIYLTGSDRRNLNSAGYHRLVLASVGFCLI